MREHSSARHFLLSATALMATPSMHGRKGYAIYGIYACPLGHNRSIEIAGCRCEQSHDAVERQCVINDPLVREKENKCIRKNV